MREIRMTFGEHLEDLRKRVIWAILWLTIGITVCFIYGKSLLKWTMGPHEIAIRGAVRDRAASILEKKGLELLALIRTAPQEAETAKDGGAPGAQAPAPSSVWLDIFAGEVFEARLEERLGGIFRLWGPKILPALGEEDRGKLLHELSVAFTETLSSENATLGGRSLPERFRLLEEDLRRTAARVGATSVKQLMGLGASVDSAIKPLAEFNRFLEERRKAVIEAGTLPARTGAAGSEFIRKLEVYHEDLRAQAKIISQDEAKPPIAISYLESFMTYFKVAIIFGLFFSIPMILYEMWKFIGAGLYANEQQWVLVFLPFSVALFFGGALFGYFSVIPVALSFLAGWGADMVEMSFTLSNYVGLFFTLTVLLGLVFQTPLVMIFLGKIGMVTPAGFRGARKWASMGSVIFAALVTPPDPLSWSLVALPMIALYELGILLVAVGCRKKQAPREKPKDDGSPPRTDPDPPPPASSGPPPGMGWQNPPPENPSPGSAGPAAAGGFPVPPTGAPLSC